MPDTTTEPQMGLTFEHVWAALLKAQEERREAREQIEAQMRDTDERIKITTATVDRMAARVDKMGERVDKTSAEVARTTANVDRLAARVDKTSAEVDRTTANVDRLAARVDKTSAEVDRTTANVDRLAARVDKTSAEVDRTTANVDKMAAKVDRVSENLGGVNRSMGELVEVLFAAKLWEKFSAFPYRFTRAYQRIPVFTDKNELLTDIDILLVNGEYAMVVEVKRNLRKDDIDRHLVRMERLHRYPQELTRGKRLLGALAAGSAGKDERDYAYESGFFVLELTGESAVLAEQPPGFKPREW